MIGEGENGKAARPGEFNQFFRGMFAVGRIRVGVQVDAPRPWFGFKFRLGCLVLLVCRFRC